MHWRSLVEGSKLYRQCSLSDKDWDRFYLQYMESRDASQWRSREGLTHEEVEKLIRFINQWATRCQLDSEKLRLAYVGLFPVIRDLKRSSLYDLEPSQRLPQGSTVSEAITDIFEAVATCGPKYYLTAASKILHTWLPDLCVMWDAAIAAGYGVYRSPRSKEYATKFLPRVSHEASEALETYIADNGGSRADAASAISKCAGVMHLTKVIDEYNWVKYTLSLDELWPT